MYYTCAVLLEIFKVKTEKERGNVITVIFKLINEFRKKNSTKYGQNTINSKHTVGSITDLFACIS